MKKLIWVTADIHKILAFGEGQFREGMLTYVKPSVRALPLPSALTPLFLFNSKSLPRCCWQQKPSRLQLKWKGEIGTRGLRVMAQAKRVLLDKLKQPKEFALSIEYESPLQIVEYPDPRLRAKNKFINKFDEKLEKLVNEMFDLMYKTDGVGLSAPQVGVNVQLMVFNPAGERGKGEEIVLINPEIYKFSSKTEVFTEGCLSFPEIYADVGRPLSVKIEAQKLTGKKFTLKLKEFHARIFQHEYDHLQGVLFFERMRPEILETIQPDLQVYICVHDVLVM
ncbi:peptide deformylase 1B, chloroplastic/mitochondrial isoform X2 [Cryptomeria japonica]|uniref:peptide deformylase 1B, chloroplastic/mitochondrial isoform X2 n=1 Tax=Cryptomeria japonica TaxID=3369 RepID=UPI0027DA38FD|nr:peptide deformylase 1B, chloroplastic/mitochondrial isoform X2 [Cryptomeria japonica]